MITSFLGNVMYNLGDTNLKKTTVHRKKFLTKLKTTIKERYVLSETTLMTLLRILVNQIFDSFKINLLFI